VERGKDPGVLSYGAREGYCRLNYLLGSPSS